MSDVLCGCGAMHHGNDLRDRLLIVLHTLIDEDFDWTDADEYADALLPLVRAYAAEQLRAAGDWWWDENAHAEAVADDLHRRADTGDQHMDLAAALDIPPIVTKWAELILRAAPDYLPDHDRDFALDAAWLIWCADTRELYNRLATLDAQHQPVRWSHTSDVIVCSCGAGAYDACPTRAVLDGRSQ